MSNQGPQDQAISGYRDGYQYGEAFQPRKGKLLAPDYHKGLAEGQAARLAAIQAGLLPAYLMTPAGR
ncbi:MAG: hypothetical protein FWD29_00080 [Micrococcales bacterium]|nr:hypothetical protein [Micrococcales bacterium]